MSASPQNSRTSGHEIIPATLLRIFLGEQDRNRSRPLYEEIVLKARDMNLAGATVLRGPLGFGRSHHLHTQKILRLSDDLPMVVEIVDTPEKIEGFLPVLEDIMTGGIATLEQISIVRPATKQSPVAA
jgi:PII-like signaling protein